MKNIQWILIIAICLYNISCQGNKLKGTPIASASSSPNNAFDGDYSTEFKSSSVNGWVGLEFSSAVKITQLGFAQKSTTKSDYLFGVFEGANDPSFMDAFPLYMITEEVTPGKIKQVQVENNQSFKYVRYIGPKGKYSVISEFEVSGAEGGKEETQVKGIYQPSKLPLVFVHTKNSQDPIDKENQITANILIVKDGAVDTQGTGTIKLRGNSTLKQDKKAFRIKFDEKKSVLGLPAKAKKWVLFANNYDKSLLRNYVGYKMSELLGLKWAPTCQHVDMILNGDFIGNYLLCDQVEVNKDRVDITPIEKTDTTEPGVTGGYILEIDGYAEQEPFYFKTAGGILFSIKVPGKDTTPEQKNYIEKKINAVEAEVNSGNLQNIDIDSFLKYFILQDFTGSPDSLWSSIYLTKERNDEKIYCGPIWDLDLAFDNVPAYGNTAELNFGYKGRMSSGNLANTVSKILGNEKVLPQLKDLWKKVTSAGLANTLTNYVDETARKIDGSQKLNFVRWDILKQTSMFNPVARGSFEEEVKALRQFIESRTEEFTKIVNQATVESVSKQTQNAFGGFGGMGGMGGMGGFGGQGGQGGWGGWGGQGGQTGGQWGGFGGQGGQTGGQWGGFGGQGGQTGGQWGGFGGFGNNP